MVLIRGRAHARKSPDFFQAPAAPAGSPLPVTSVEEVHVGGKQATGSVNLAEIDKQQHGQELI